MHQSFPLSPWECHDNLSRRGGVSIGELPSRSIVFPHLLQTSFVLRPGANRNCQLLYILILINGKVQKVYQYVRPSRGSVVWEEDHPFYSPEGGGKNEKLFASFYIDVLQQTSQELRMLSRSLFDCRSLLLNLNLNLNRCLCLCSDCSDCSVTVVSL